MKQVTQDFRHGRIALDDVPAPLLRERGVIIRTRYSVVSVGTERATLEFAAQGLAGKARARPDLVQQVIRKIKTDGLLSAYRAAQSRLDTLLAPGYSSAGEVIEVGSLAPGLRVGDRVACAGMGFASHAELTYVPRNLLAKIPDGVADEDAAFAAIGAIALQGVRLADLRLGERVVVIGLGLIGLMTVQMARAAGCLVLGTDLNPERVKLALTLGANAGIVTEPADLSEMTTVFTAGRGADAVIITAATKSNAPTEIAGEISRLKGRVVAVGDVGMNIPRRIYYQKELDYRISMSYGPGRYDPEYEEKGLDYPYAYVPFTEQRNMETFLTLVQEGKVRPDLLVSHRFAIDEAEKAYEMMEKEDSEHYLGIVFSYPRSAAASRRLDLGRTAKRAPNESGIRLGVIGAGIYAKGMLLPHLSKLPEVKLVGLITATGISGKLTARKYGFDFCATDDDEVLDNPDINAVVIATRHDAHANQVIRALANGDKHVFVEKPLATNEADLAKIVEAYRNSNKVLMVGFNRRYAPFALMAKEAFAGHAGPLSMLYRVNAGTVPRQHWTQDREEGGGRIIGEVCHFIDLLQFFCGSRVKTVLASPAGNKENDAEDTLAVTLRFQDGSLGTIAYFSSGNKLIPKEYLEIYGDGKTFIIDDFKRVRYAVGNKLKVSKAMTQDKGQALEMAAFRDAVLGKGPVPDFAEIVHTSLATFRVIDSLRSGLPVAVDWSRDHGQ